ncbi:MAG: DUF4407 domain-containing protein [Verrucomicrobiales bacterium]|nr:DUF4407 domain-containing protein [Verrucomicrobiales bacterium]
MNASTSKAKHLFFWLSGAGADTLEECPNWEQRKYVAFGATVLVPTIFAFIACAYALSTLTDNWSIILPVSAVWSFIILTIDRALLATYRSYQSFFRKMGQFFLRILVAILMGLTISHPLTLLLFNDSVTSVIEEERETEIAGVRDTAIVDKKVVEDKIAALETDIADQRQKFEDTFRAEFLVEDTSVADPDPSAELDPDLKQQHDERVANDTAGFRQKVADIDDETAKLTASYTTVQTDLDHWQTEFEREVNGQRSGIIGLGPRARSIRDDQLAWRREEAKRLGELLATMTNQKTDLQTQIKSTEDAILEEFLVIAADRAERQKAERERVAVLKQQVQAQQAGQFVEQQNTIRSTIAAQIDTRLAEMERLQGELASIGTQEQERIDAIKAEPRRDIIHQTLALHGMFGNGEEGGKFALIAYLVLGCLFMLVDTIPLVVKFFCKAGPYDTLVDCEEVRYDRERKAFLESYHKYMDELAGGKLLHLTQNKPLERAFVEGIDQSKSANAFLEHLMDLESSFQGRVDQEQERLASADASKSSRSAEMLEEFSDTFYSNMRTQMESFFDRDAVKAAAASRSS